MPIECEIAQTQFLSMGGSYARALANKRERGELPKDYEFREYPKMLRVSQGMQEIERSTEDVKGRTITWTENREVFEETVVYSEDEEDRVLSGGKTSAQIEGERQGLILRARGAGLKVDPSWSAVRLRRELGDALDAPSPGDEMAALEDKLARLRKMAEMQAEIERLSALVSGKTPDDPDDMRAQLATLGVKVDGRWSASRLREELDKATEPRSA